MRKGFFSVFLLFLFSLGYAQSIDYTDVKFDKQDMLKFVNQARMEKRRCGGTQQEPVPPLKWNDKLAKAAQKHANDMAKNNFFDHIGSDGSTVDVRIERKGYLWRAVGENVAMGPRSVREAVDGWLDSPGHCTNIMNGDFTEMGAALSYDGKYWVQVFAAPR